jgi:hypothetical protein
LCGTSGEKEPLLDSNGSFLHEKGVKQYEHVTAMGRESGAPRVGKLSSDDAVLSKPKELPRLSAKDQQDVAETVEFLLRATESIAAARDPEIQLHKQIRAVKTRVEQAKEDGVHSKIGDLFNEIDTDGSGRLAWDEVCEGAAKLGVKDKKGQDELRVLFSQVADEWREVDRRQFDYLLVSLRAAQLYGSAYVFEVTQAINALTGELNIQAARPVIPAERGGKGKVRYATTTSTAGGPLASGKYSSASSRSSSDTRQRDSWNIICSAAQKICRLSHHGDETERRRRQSYMSDQGAIALLTKVLLLDNHDCVFWAAQALLALVEDNGKTADIFHDTGGVDMISELICMSPLSQPSHPPQRPVIPRLALKGHAQEQVPQEQAPQPLPLKESACHALVTVEKETKDTDPECKLPARTQTALVHLADAACNSSADTRRCLETDTRLATRAIRDIQRANMPSSDAYSAGTQFTCFTGTTDKY